MSFRFLTAGESHGKALVGILEGLPGGIPLDLESLQKEMKRRKLGYGRSVRQAIESDTVEVLSGIRQGKTIGSPIALCIWNKESSAFEKSFFTPRPGHADYTGAQKYQEPDLRNILERASARETAMRFALGAVCKQFCKFFGISFGSYVFQIGRLEANPAFFSEPHPAEQLSEKSDLSPVRCLDPQASQAMQEAIQEVVQQGNSLGGAFEVQASGLPIGLGSHVHWDRKLSCAIGGAFLSLNGIKGVEVGQGSNLSLQKGSEVHDVYDIDSKKNILRLSNRSGGLDAGMSNGKNLIVRASMKPLSTLAKPLNSVNLQTKEKDLAHTERSDGCAVPAAATIGEMLLALVITEALLEKFGGDSLSEIQERVSQWNQKTQSSPL